MKAGKAWTWGPIVAGLAAAAILYFGGLNEPGFLLVNGGGAKAGHAFWAAWTVLGDGLFSLVLLLPWIRRRPRTVWTAVLAVLLVTILVQSLKYFFNEPRPLLVLSPEHVHLIGPSIRFRSFPSGHAATAFAFAGVFILAGARRWVRWSLIGGAAMVALSRMAVGVHWPVDIAAGAALGWMAALLASGLAARSRWAWSGAGLRVVGALLLAAGITLYFAGHTGFPEVAVIQRVLAAVCLAAGVWEYAKLWRVPHPRA